MGVICLELKDIQALMQEFEDSDTRELEITDGSFHLYLSKNRQTRTHDNVAVKDEVASAPESPAKTVKNEKDNAVIKAPLVGTVYLQPKPDADPYVKVGDLVKKGDVVCVIEAMKMMTEIRSDFTGIIKDVHVSNEELVEVEQPLFTIVEEKHND